jgi:thioester reductase-like protein
VEDKPIILITGGTGSLGSHLVEYFSNLTAVGTVVCLNRFSGVEPKFRQEEAMKSRGIQLEPEAISKLKVLQSDTSKPMVGLPSGEYEYLVSNVTHIVHNAWPMSITRPISAFESQFKATRNLIGLARDAYCRQGIKIGFQFISSVATVGYHPLHTGEARVLERRVTAASVLPTGYGDAKMVCERVLEETLHQYPDWFRPMTIRIGQIAGSRTSGYWNTMEHFSFMIRSSATLKTLPDLQGVSGTCHFVNPRLRT